MQKAEQCPKSVTHLTCYNRDIHERIFTIFGRNVTDKISNQKLLYFPTSLN